MRHIIWVICLLCTSLIARGQTNYEYVYWFDGDYASRKMASSDTTKLTFQTDVSELSETLHTLHLQVRSASGVWSSPLTRMFVNMRKTDTREGWYWFDDEDKAREKQNISGLFDVDVSMLDNGLHTIHYMAVDTKGNTASPVSRTFLKIEEKGEGLTYRCWFDNKNDSIFTGTITDNLFWLDVSSLEDGFHTLHLQVRSASGVWSSPLTRMFVNMRKTDTREGWYWFDDEDKAREKQNISGLFDVDVSMLDNGLHTIHYMAVDAKGNTASPVSRTFLKIAEKGEELTYRCWFDNKNDSIFTGTITDNLFWLDVSSLEDGLHTVHVQVLNHLDSSPLTYQFLKTPQIIGVEYLTCLCYIDGKLYHQERVSSSDGVVNWNLDVSALKQGMHTIQVQIVTPSGVASSLCEGMFIRSTTGKEMASLKCFYTIDNAESRIEAGSYADGTFHFDLDVASLTDGLHQLTYMLLGDNGVSTKISSSFFVKTPVGGNGIAHYEYWLNDDEAHKTVVELEKRTNPLQLIGLLPVESVPIRSSCFHFEVDEEKGPMLYAKNEFHIRFFDATGRLTDATKPYLDYNVGEKVEDTAEIKKTQTFARPEENTIKWFTLQACEGDTIAFCSSQALSLQVFSPSGEEIYRTSEAESVKWGGCHTWENGTYYVAVHDVTGSRPDVTLEYMHMDKYDVVDWNVHKVGNGGCSTITFQGNGFKDLYAVDLYNAQGDTIRSIDVGHESDAETSVTFDFTDTTLGEYDALFHFTEEDKLVANVVTVEEAVDIELATDVTFPSTFLRGTSTTYTVKITNKGNMTAYCIPLDLRMKISSLQDVSEVWFSDNLEHFTIPQELCPSSLDENVSIVLKEVLKDYSDLAQFVFYTDSLENVTYGLSQLFLNISPNTTETFAITINCSSTVYLDATISTEWVPLTLNNRAFTYKRVKRSGGEWMCCNRTKIQCVADVAANIVGGFLPPGANCALSLSVTGLGAVYDVLCSDGNTAGEKFQNYLKSEGKSLTRKLINSAITCVTGYFDKYLKDLKKARQEALDANDMTRIRQLNREIFSAENSLKNILSNLGKNIVYGFVGKDCVEAFIKSIPNCPPKPGGGGGSSTPVNSYDPNEIYGYLSPSGSKFIAKDSVEAIDYRIEFENDTAFATSAAHVVEIIDTLDADFFELSTFEPTYFNIGNKREQLDGTPNFVRTVDMRPEINVIVQVEGQYDEKKGIARWLFTSLDPMTMEPTDDVMQGFLPVNHDGTSGIGDVGYRIGVKKGLEDGLEITNRASIVFDANEPILTPTWTNIVDGVCPESMITEIAYKNDSIVTLNIEGNDERSGVWKYDLYVQYGVGSPWMKEGELSADSTQVDYKVHDGLYYGFCVLATDSAGNMEQKELRPEVMCADIHLGDVNSDGEVNSLDASLVMAYYLEEPVSLLLAAADVNEDGEVNTLDATLIIQMYLNSEQKKESAPKLKQLFKIQK